MMCIFIASIERNQNANIPTTGERANRRERKWNEDIRHCSFVTEIEWVCSFSHTASFHELNHKYIIALVNFGKLPTSNNGVEREEREKEKEKRVTKSYNRKITKQ